MKDLSGRYCMSSGRVWDVKLRNDSQYEIYSIDPKYPSIEPLPTRMSQEDIEKARDHGVIELCKEDGFSKLYITLKT